MAVGNPKGYEGTVSNGIISAFRENNTWIQFTAPISQGSSGGALINLRGEVVGMPTKLRTDGQNLNFAIDIRELDKLALDKHLTLAEVYDAEYPDGVPSTSGEDGFYQEADCAEDEPNDLFLLSDLIENSTWIAGEISNTEDLDWFYFELEAPGDVSFEVIPYYTDDMDYLLCGILSLNDEEDDVELMDSLTPTMVDGYEELAGTIHFDAAGSYFLVICVEDSYPYSESSYYALCASW